MVTKAPASVAVPTYKEMVLEAIEDNGGKVVSRPAVFKFVTQKYGLQHDKVRLLINRALKNLLDHEEIKMAKRPGMKGSGSYSLTSMKPKAKAADVTKKKGTKAKTSTAGGKKSAKKVVGPGGKKTAKKVVGPGGKITKKDEAAKGKKGVASKKGVATKKDATVAKNVVKKTKK